MKMHNLCSLILIVIPSFFHRESVAAKHEPSCSKFDYEEKLLEKMIRMEMKMEQVVNELKKAKDDMSITTKDVTQKVENVEQDILKYQRSINESMNTFAEKFEQEKTKISTLSEKAYVPIIAFNTRLSSTVQLSSGTTVVFDTVLMNEGEGYDKISGIFSSSQSGLYFFAVHVCINANKAVHYKIVKEGHTIAVSTQYDLDRVITCNSVSTVAMVNTGERVWVQTTSSSHLYTDSYRWNTFVGVLLNRPVV